MSLSQLAASQLGWGFHILRRGIDPGNVRLRPRVVGVLEIWKDFWPGDGNLSSPGCHGFMYDPQPIIDRPVGLGFPHRGRRFRSGGSPLYSPGCRSCKGIEGFLIRGWKLILPGVRWLYVRSPASQRPASAAGVSTPCGAASTRGITLFVPVLSEFWMYVGIAEPGMDYPPRVRRDRGVSPGSNSRRARLAP